MSLVKIEVKKISVGTTKPLELSRQLTHVMYNHMMETFDQEGPGWKPLSNRTKKQRLRQGFGEGPILDRKRGRLGLRGSIIEAASETQALVGVRSGLGAYPFAHQFGARIVRVTKPGKVRLRKNKSGKTVFAKKTHKKVTEVNMSFGKRYTILIPIRRFLNVTAALKEKIAAIARKSFQSNK